MCLAPNFLALQQEKEAEPCIADGSLIKRMHLWTRPVRDPIPGVSRPKGTGVAAGGWGTQRGLPSPLGTITYITGA